MPRKRKSPPLYVSLQRIDKERSNVEKRTKLRIAELFADTENRRMQVDRQIQKDRQIQEWHGCLNTCCFCLTLLTFNLLFLQWLYIKVA
jgi:hypothetical protein